MNVPVGRSQHESGLRLSPSSTASSTTRTGFNLTALIAALRTRPYFDLKVLFRAQGKLHHPFEQLVRGQASEIVHDQLLGVESHEVAKLQRLAA